MFAKGFEYKEIPYQEGFKVWFGQQEDVYYYPVTVLDVLEEGGAESAGLEGMFEIYSVNGVEVGTVDRLKEELGKNKSDDVVLSVGYLDDGIGSGHNGVGGIS